MAPYIINKKQWKYLAPILPPAARGGRPRLDDHAVLNGILFVLLTGIPWKGLPCSLGCGSGMTCWRRWREWQEQGVWSQLYEAIVALEQAGHINLDPVHLMEAFPKSIRLNGTNWGDGDLSSSIQQGSLTHRPG